jgi:hypothetical protein
VNKSRKLKWAGHVERKGVINFVEEPEGKIPLGRKDKAR